jgi:hypothetical protein
MSIEDLYSEMGVTFQPTQRRLFLQEVAAAARDLRSSLGPIDDPAEVQDESERDIQELMGQFERDIVEFSPRLDVLPLGRKDFKDRNILVPSHIANLFKRFNFFLVHFPITLFPKAGYAFVQLDCIVEFNRGRSPLDRPVAYQIFPEMEWEDVIRFEQGLAVGLDENFEFRVDVERLKRQWPGLGADVRAAVGAKAAGRAGLIAGPFDYRIRRPKIQTGGQGNVKVRWRLDSEEYFQQEEPQLGLVLQVPKTLSCVDACGAIKAVRNFQFFTTPLRYLLQYVKTSTRSFFKAGIPVVDGKDWQNITAGV